MASSSASYVSADSEHMSPTGSKDVEASDAGRQPMLGQEAEEDQSCGLKRYKNWGACALFLFLNAGIALIIYVTATQSSSGGPPAAPLQSYGLEQMFDPALSPQRAAIAWLQRGAVASSDPNADAFVTVVNGSFYMTIMPEMGKPVLLIDAEDLNKYAPLTPNMYSSDDGRHGRKLLQEEQQQQHEVLPDPIMLHTRRHSRLSPRNPRPSMPRTLRARPSHQMQEESMAMQWHEQRYAEIPTQEKEQHHQQRTMSHASTHFSTMPSATIDASSVAAADVFKYNRYDLSPDYYSMLFGMNCTQLYRHSSFCVYGVWSVQAKNLQLLAGGSPVRLALWSPDSTQVAYVKDNNLYIQRVHQDGSPLGTPVQVTTDGEWDAIINGVADWVSEEEIFEATSTTWWSPDSTALAFIKFNETQVPLYQFEFFTSPYNEEFVYKYPKAGYPNSIVDILVYNLSSKSLHSFGAELRAKVKSEKDFEVEYIVNVEWDASSRAVMARVIDRAQKNWQVVWLDTSSNLVRLLHGAREQYYFEPHACLTSLTHLGVDSYVDLVFDGVDHRHLALFHAEDGRLQHFLTGGDFDVLNLDSVYVVGQSMNAPEGGIQADPSKIHVQYTREISQTAARMASPALYSVPLSTTSNGTTDSVRLVSYEDGDRLTSQSASFSATGSYFVLQENAVDPRSTLFKLTPDPDVHAEKLKVLADNTELLKKLRETYALPTTTYTSIPSTLAGLELSVSISAPAGVDLSKCSGTRSYPVLIYAYGGPGSQSVLSSFGMGYASQASFHASLSSSSDFIVVTVDPVGTAGKGERYRKSHTYLQLGLQERADLIHAAEWVRSQCWSDASRVSHWGWSYGGFMSSFIAAAGTGIYEHLISVAPVTSWRLYDSVYTERYMMRPVDNPEGYSKTSVVEAASNKFDASSWSLWSGTADDNVHWQNSALLVDRLINLDLPADVFYFPNRAHSLTAWKTGAPPRYLYERLTKLLTGKGGPSGQKK